MGFEKVIDENKEGNNTTNQRGEERREEERKEVKYMKVYVKNCGLI